MEESALYGAYDFSQPWDSPKNQALAARMPRLFAFHGAEGSGSTVANYLAVVGAGTVWPGSTAVSSTDVTDPQAMTILLVENQGAMIHWMEPRDLSLADLDFGVNRPGGISSPYDDPAVAMLDGNLHRLGPGITPETLRALLTIRGGEQVQPGVSGGFELLPDGRQRPLRPP